MAYDLWTQDMLLATVKDDRMDPVPNFALSNYFKGDFYSAHKEIRIDELPQDFRYMAPFVHWSDRGRPIAYEQGMKSKWFTPAYIKLKNSVSIEMLLRPLITEYRRDGQQLGPQDRYDAEVAKIVLQHNRAIDIRKEAMAWEALRFATQTFDYLPEQGQPYPQATVNYERDSNLTVLKNSSYWSDPATSIYSDVEDWAHRMDSAVRGGFPTTLIVGRDVARVFRKNTEIKAMMHADTRDNGTNFDRAMTRVNYQGLTYIGTLPLGIEVYTFSDYYTDPSDNSVKNFMDPKEVLLIAPGYNGVKANGLIYDMDILRSGGGAFSGDVYASSWSSADKDHSVDWVMHQASPLVIPLHPNKSFRARVLAA